MTTEEMKSKILDHCEITRCGNCKLSNKGIRHCHVSATPEEIKENYNILFGKEENMGMFKKEDIKPGYVLEITNNDRSVRFAMVAYNKEEELCVSSEFIWGPLKDFDDNLERKRTNSKITKIYGYSINSEAYQVSAYQRDLLWERKEPKEMTLKEVEEALGYPVKIIKE